MGLLVIACLTPLLTFQMDEVPGDYFSGFGEALTLRANHQFEYSGHNCFGVNETANGTWSRDDDVVELHAVSHDFKDNSHFQTRFVPIHFKGFVTLAEENAVAPLADAMRDDLDYFKSYPISFLKRDSKGVPAISSNRTQIPKRYRTYFEQGGIDAKVTRIVSEGEVEIELDSSRFVNLGTRLTVRGLDRMELEIESAFGSKALAKVWYLQNSDRQIKLGDDFFSGNACLKVAPESERRYGSPTDIASTRVVEFCE